jgi:hypothetical protein
MFISKQEKVSILRRLVVLEEMVKNLNALQDSKTIGSKERSTSGWTQEARARHSARLKKSWADRKAAA